jgi:predicted phosphodiesterase
MNKNFFAACITSFFLLASSLHAQPQHSERFPQRVVLNVTAKPASSMAVTWRTAQQIVLPKVQVARTGQWSDFDKQARTLIALSNTMRTDRKELAWYYSAIMDSLSPGTFYAYRVGGDSIWSEWNQFTTASTKADPFRFVYFGDPQNDLTTYVSRIFREAFRRVPDARFWLIAGDLTSEPEDSQNEEFYYAAGFAFRMIPTIMVAGNHDRGYQMENGEYVLNAKGRKTRMIDLSPFWSHEFTLPANGVAGLEESNYSIDYQGVRILVINSNTRLPEQAAWMEKLLANNPNRWTIVAFHHPIYSMGADRDDKDTRTAFLPLFDRYHVDLVLTGHDHTYGRTWKLVNGVRVNDKRPGTIYVVSVSGPKAYPLTTPYKNLMAKIGEKVQLFQEIFVNGRTLQYKAIAADGSLYDSCTLKKK